MNPRATSLAILLFCSGAAAQVNDPTTNPHEETEVDPESTPREPKPDEDGHEPMGPSPERAAMEAMAHYEVGEFDEALSGLRSVVRKCLSEGAECSSTELASHYASLAVVLSSTSSNPQAAVVVWRKALVLDPDLEIAPAHRTPQVLRAYDEAKRGDEVPAKPEQRAPAGGEVTASDQSHASRTRRNFILSTGSLKGGVIASDLLSEGIGEGESAVAVGGLPFDQGAFALGVRARGGGQFPEAGLGGFWGAGFLAGALLGRRRSRSFSYFFGEAGMKHFIGGETVHPALQVVAGRSFGGLLVGGVLDYSYGRVDEQASVSSRGLTLLPVNGHVIQLGVEVGSGQLF